MSGQRRFSITKEQGELCSLALSLLIEELTEIQSRDSSQFWTLQRERAEWLKRDIDEYRWIKERTV